MADTNVGTLMVVTTIVLSIGLLGFYGAPVTGGFEDTLEEGDVVNTTQLQDAGITNPGPFVGVIGDVVDTLAELAGTNPLMSAFIAVLVVAGVGAALRVIPIPLTG